MPKHVDFTTGMNKVKKVLAVLIIIVVTIALGITVGENESKIRTQFELIEDARLQGNIEGVEEGDEVRLYDPDDEHLDSYTISSDDITRRLIGIVQTTVELSMTDEGNPLPGDYTFVINDNGETIYEEELTFDGPEIEITDLELETESLDQEWEITGIELDVENEGDLPIFADRMDLTVGEESENISLYEELFSEETTVIYENVSIEVDEGTHPVGLELYSYDEKFGSYETEISFGE